MNASKIKIMPYFFTLILVAVSVMQIAAQDFTSKVKDSLYKEDQFYIGTTYNVIGRGSSDVKQTGFSLGFYLGFIKDMPINKRRNLAIGLGLGYATNSYIQNILIDQDANGNSSFSLINDNAVRFSNNKFSEHVIELPLELRWRTSTVTSYKFWRIYAGVKLAYVVDNRSKFEGSPSAIRQSNIQEYNRFQYGPTLSLGYNTWNIYAYYGLNSVFSDAVLDTGVSLDINVIKLGIIFYIL